MAEVESVASDLVTAPAWNADENVYPPLDPPSETERQYWTRREEELARLPVSERWQAVLNRPLPCKFTRPAPRKPLPLEALTYKPSACAAALTTPLEQAVFSSRRKRRRGRGYFRYRCTRHEGPQPSAS